jgi:hypothetical protein
MLKKIAGNSVLYFMSSQAHNVINIVMYPLISEFLVAEDFRNYTWLCGNGDLCMRLRACVFV